MNRIDTERRELLDRWLIASSGALDGTKMTGSLHVRATDTCTADVCKILFLKSHFAPMLTWRAKDSRRRLGLMEYPPSWAHSDSENKYLSAESVMDNETHLFKVEKASRIALTIGAIVALLGVSLFPLLQIFGRPVTVPPVSVHVYDEAGVLNDSALSESLSRITFVHAVKISVLTLPALDEETLNYRVLEYGRNASLEEPWIDPHAPEYWADGTLILAVAPRERQVGTYFGEDIAVGLNAQTEIQDAMKDDLRNLRFNEAFEAGAREASAQFDTSWANSTLGWSVSLVAAYYGVSWIVAKVKKRRKALRLYEEARSNYAQVSADFEATSIDAGILDQTDIHGHKVYERYGEYLRDYHQLTRLFQDFDSHGLIESFTPAFLKNTTLLRDKAVALNQVDDGISNTAAFLTMSSRWPQVWHNEIGPLYEDIDALEQLASDARGDFPELRSTARQTALAARHRLPVMYAELQARTLTPSAALSELDEMSLGLWALSRRLLDAAMHAARQRGESVGSADVDDLYSGNTTSYRGQWREDGQVQTYRPGSTIRANRGRTVPTSTGTAGNYASPSSPALAGLVVGYSSSRMNPDYVASRSSSSGSSSSSSYSSSSFSGGGFSGSGSSSSY